MEPVESPMKKIIDFDFIERYTECTVCLEQFKEPRLLPCSHTYCTNCIEALAKTTDQIDGNFLIVCPQCLTNHSLPIRNGIHSYPINLAIKQLLDIKPIQLISDKKCESCCKYFAFSNCFHCNKSVCLDCQRNHQLILKSEIENDINELNELYDNYINNFKSKIKNFLLSSNKTKNLISSITNDLIEEFKSRESFLLSKIDNLIDEKMSSFNDDQQGFLEQNETIQSFINCFSSELNNSLTINELVSYKSKFDSYKDLYNNFSKDTSKNDDLQIDFLEIEPFSSAAIKKQIKNYGDVIINNNKSKIDQSELGIKRADSVSESNYEFTPPSSENESPRSVKNISILETERVCLDFVRKIPSIWKGSDNFNYWCPSDVVYEPTAKEIFIADSFNHAIKVLNASSPNLIRSSFPSYQDSGKYVIDLNTPRGICIDQTGHLVVTDSGNNKCVVLDRLSFEKIFEFGREGNDKGEFSNPRGVCVDHLNRIYICDRGNHRIQVFDNRGNFLKEWGSHGSLNGQFKNPEFIYASPNNHLLVSDTHNHRIQIFNIESKDSSSIEFGTYVTSFGKYGKNYGEFRFPRGVTTDPEGFIMVADWKNNRLQLFEPDGNFVTEITKNDFKNKLVNLDRPVGICLTSKGGGLVVTNWGRSQNVQIL